MLFNSYIFIFAFLPITYAIYFILAKYLGGEKAIIFLVLSSLFFYSWWNPTYLILMLCSIGFNYFIGETIVKFLKQKNFRFAKLLFVIGIIFNLGLLGYFKYANFFIENFNTVFDTHIKLDKIILPLAISFFTFQQIAYLVDTYKGITEEFKFFHYALFVTFFPQLIAGPIVHHKEMLPQFLKMENMKPRLEHILVGLTIFSLGLFKKVVFADSSAQYSTPVFDLANTGETLSFFVAWGGALSYTFQLYFDFSGYSDMAIGIARMFGIHLPVNFFSPYKALNIIEFWRRWHITLSRFLRDYIYISLGGNRKGNTRRYTNLLTTMLLGGLWHGAGWTFVLWGGLHGLYLVINHIWHYFKNYCGMQFLDNYSLWKLFSWLITFTCVINAWVFFRADNISSALRILEGMYGLNGISLPNAIYTRLDNLKSIFDTFGITSYIGGGSQFIFTYLWVGILLFISLMMPNTQQIMSRYSEINSFGHALFNQGVASNILTFRFNSIWAFIMSGILILSIFGLARVSEFLYFQF